jgi:exodeoxyribonuclease VII small subunit
MATTVKTKATAPHPQSFEDALSELEGIITRMEAGQMPLEESLAAYKQGILLLRECQATLNTAEQQIRILQSENLQPFSPATLDEPKD